MITFSQYVLKEGGSVHPLFVENHESGKTGLMNPSVFVDNDRILVNLRSVNYFLYHAEKRKFPNRYGHLCHMQPENTDILRTTNYLTELDENYEIKTINKIDTSLCDSVPGWLFHGLEDARVVRWNGDLYLCGVRRDTTSNGEGRMELSKIVGSQEVSRVRIPSPGGDTEYCEKNWMPLVDKPFHFLRWANPVEIIKYNVEEEKVEVFYRGRDKLDLPLQQRGGSHVITVGDYHICATHEVEFCPDELGRKDGIYTHRFIVYDKYWNISSYTPSFNLMGAKIEFITGMAKHGDDILISFGFQDNAAYLLRISQKSFLKFLLDY